MYYRVKPSSSLPFTTSKTHPKHLFSDSRRNTCIFELTLHLPFAKKATVNLQLCEIYHFGYYIYRKELQNY